MTSLTPPIFIEVCVPSQDICVWVINLTAVFTIFRLDLDTVLTVWYFYFLFYKITCICTFKETIHVLNITKMSPHEVSS